MVKKYKDRTIETSMHYDKEGRKILVGRLKPTDTGHIHTTIDTLNWRVDEIKHELSKEDNHD